MQPGHAADQKVGQSQAFVLARGFRKVGVYWALVGADGSLRLFAEVTADADRPDVRPKEAYQMLLSSIVPGWSVRILQIFWPDPLPRDAFQKQAETWGAALFVPREPAASAKRSCGRRPFRPGGPGLSARTGCETAFVGTADGKGEGLKLLHDALLLHIREAPLPFIRRTVIEFVYPGTEDALAWWEGIQGNLLNFGLKTQPLTPENIQELARWVLNPRLDI